jgi:hypothetical protein
VRVPDAFARRLGLIFEFTVPQILLCRVSLYVLEFCPPVPQQLSRKIMAANFPGPKVASHFVIWERMGGNERNLFPNGKCCPENSSENKMKLRAPRKHTAQEFSGLICPRFVLSGRCS